MNQRWVLGSGLNGLTVVNWVLPHLCRLRKSTNRRRSENELGVSANVGAGHSKKIRKFNERLETWRGSTGSLDRWLVLEPWCGPAAKPDLSRLPPPFRHMPEAPVPQPPNAYSLPRFVPQPPVAPTRMYLAPQWEARGCDAQKNSKTNVSCPA